MICYRCSSTLDVRKDICSKCGADIRYFKKIVYASNRYYNEGLMKAQARDLTGAKDCLKKSLHLYKKNTNARNLLGLVYYAMGESAEALKEWLISRNYAAKGNMAERFINSMHRNMKNLDSEDHGIKKYNQALEYCRNGAKDLATIQLKKVVSVHSNMVKAYELLALLYIDDGKYDQAEKILKKCLETDRGNTSALYYLKELRNMRGAGGARNVGTVGEDDREQLIIPVRFRDYGSYLSNALYIFLGLLIGIAIAWFVIVPARVQRETGDAVAAARSYEAQIAELQEDLKNAEKKAEEHSETPEPATQPSESDTSDTEPSSEPDTEPPESDSEDEPTESEPEETFAEIVEKIERWKANNEKLLEAVECYGSGDIMNTVRNFYMIDRKQVAKAYELHYRNLAVIVTDDGVYNRLIGEAEAYEDDKDYENAAKAYDALTLLHPDEVSNYINAAKQYRLAKDNKNAANRYWEAAVLFPGTEQAEESEKQYLKITKKDSLPEIPEGTDVEALLTRDTVASILEDAGLEETEPPETPEPETEPEEPETSEEESPAPEEPAPEESPAEQPPEEQSAEQPAEQP